MKRDFEVVGVLEELHIFLTLLAHRLEWPLDAVLYEPRKMHNSERALNPCGRRLNAREEERVRKRANAEEAKHRNASIQWSGNFPLLGWNDPTKGHLRTDVRKFIEQRNKDDMALWNYAKKKAHEDMDRLKLNDAKGTFDRLHHLYADGRARNFHGYFAFCDWRIGNDIRNSHCRQCADSLPTEPCLDAFTCRRVSSSQHDRR